MQEDKEAVVAKVTFQKKKQTHKQKVIYFCGMEPQPISGPGERGLLTFSSIQIGGIHLSAPSLGHEQATSLPLKGSEKIEKKKNKNNKTKQHSDGPATYHAVNTADFLSTETWCGSSEGRDEQILLMSLESNAAEELLNSKRPEATLTSSPELAISAKTQDMTRVHDSSVSSGGSCNHTS